MIEFLFELFLEILGQIVCELLTGFGWEALGNSLPTERKPRPWLASVGFFLMGLAAGLLSLLLFPIRVTQRVLFAGVSLILSPLGTGLAMQWLGDVMEQRGGKRPVLFTFRAGAIFAFGMALVRFVYFER